MDTHSITAQLAAAGLDPRMAAARPDLADEALRDLVSAARYAAPTPLMCTATYTPILDAPEGAQTSELLELEQFDILESANGWSWGWSAHDHYVGYVFTSALGPVSVDKEEGPGGDAAAYAHQFLDMPYVWGGRGGAGIDCSGLVQRSMNSIGVAALRDSDMQRETLGEFLPENAELKRGDIIFFPGHVGMMVDEETMIHATRYHNKTVTEPLAVVVARVIRKHGLGILARKRVMQ